MPDVNFTDVSVVAISAEFTEIFMKKYLVIRNIKIIIAFYYEDDVVMIL